MDHKIALLSSEVAEIKALMDQGETLTYSTETVIPELKGREWNYMEYLQVVWYSGDDEIERPTFWQAVATFNGYGMLASEVHIDRRYYCEVHGEDVYVVNYTDSKTGEHCNNQVWSRDQLIRRIMAMQREGWMLFDEDMSEIKYAVMIGKLNVLIDELRHEGMLPNNIEAAKHLMVTAAYCLKGDQRNAEIYAAFANHYGKLI